MSCEHNDLYACQDCSMDRMLVRIAYLEEQLSERDEELARCVDALDHIMKVAGQAHRPTRRLDWISDRARIAVSGKDYSEALMPQYPKNNTRSRTEASLPTSAQAAAKVLDEAYERAAQACELQGVSTSSDRHYACHDCADAIRNMKAIREEKEDR